MSIRANDPSDEEPVTFCGAPLGAKEQETIATCVARFPRLSRAELATTVCEW